MPMNPRLLRPLDTGFNPSKIAGLQLWLDGSDSSVFTLNGSTVSQWRDKSGNSRHFAQATAAQQPVAASNVKNGRGAVAFTNDWMTGTYTYQIGSVFAVWNHPTTVAGDSLPAIVSSRTSNSNRTGNGVLPFNISIPASGAGFVAVEPFPAGTVSYRLNGSVPNTASLNSFTTGVAIRTSPDRWQHLSATFSPVSGSQAFTLGGDTLSATVRMMQDGHIGEVLFYSAQLSASEVKKVEDYLVRKWGL
jgi:hypothetical protein